MSQPRKPSPITLTPDLREKIDAAGVMSANDYQNHLNTLYAKNPGDALDDLTYTREYYLGAKGERRALDKAINNSEAMQAYREQSPESYSKTSPVAPLVNAFTSIVPGMLTLPSWGVELGKQVYDIATDNDEGEDKSWITQTARGWTDFVNGVYDKTLKVADDPRSAKLFKEDGSLSMEGVGHGVMQGIGQLGSLFATRGASLPNNARWLITYAQSLQLGYEGLKDSGMTRDQLGLMVPIFAGIEAITEKIGGERIMKILGIGEKEASIIARQMGQDSMAEAIKTIGKGTAGQITEDTFQNIVTSQAKRLVSQFDDPKIVGRYLANAGKAGNAELIEEAVTPFLQEGVNRFLRNFTDTGQQAKPFFDQETFNRTGNYIGGNDLATDATMGGLLGFVIGGGAGISMGPWQNTQIQQQSLFAKLDHDITTALGQGVQLFDKSGKFDSAKFAPDPNNPNDPNANSFFSILGKLQASGKLSEQDMANIAPVIDRMAGVSAALSSVGLTDKKTRYALYDIRSTQDNFNSVFDTEVVKKQAELANLQDADTADKIFLRTRLSQEKLPEKEKIGTEIKERLKRYASLMADPNESEKAVKEYRSDIDALLQQFNDLSKPRKTEFSEADLDGQVTKIIRHQNGTVYGLRTLPDGNVEAVRVNRNTAGGKPKAKMKYNDFTGEVEGIDQAEPGTASLSFSALDGEASDFRDRVLSELRNNASSEDYESYREQQQQPDIDRVVELRNLKGEVDKKLSDLTAKGTTNEQTLRNATKSVLMVDEALREAAFEDDNAYTPFNYIADLLTGEADLTQGLAGLTQEQFDSFTPADQRDVADLLSLAKYSQDEEQSNVALQEVQTILENYADQSNDRPLSAEPSQQGATNDELKGITASSTEVDDELNEAVEQLKSDDPTTELAPEQAAGISGLYQSRTELAVAIDANHQQRPDGQNSPQAGNAAGKTATPAANAESTPDESVEPAYDLEEAAMAGMEILRQVEQIETGDVFERADPIEAAIARTINRVKREDFERYGDKNKINRSMAMSYFGKEGQSFDRLAIDAGSNFGLEITADDVAAYIEKYPNGLGGPKSKSSLTFYGANNDYSQMRDLLVDFEAITGMEATDENINNILTKFKEFRDNQDYIEQFGISEQDYQEYVMLEELAPQEEIDAIFAEEPNQQDDGSTEEDAGVRPEQTGDQPQDTGGVETESPQGAESEVEPEPQPVNTAVAEAEAKKIEAEKQAIVRKLKTARIDRNDLVQRAAKEQAKEQQALFEQKPKEQLKAVRPGSVQYFLSTPNSDGSFNFSSAKPGYTEGATLFEFEPAGGNRFNVYLSDQPGALKMISSYDPGRTTDPAFDSVSAFNPSAKSVQTVKPAVVELQGDKFRLVEKGQMDYDNVGINRENAKLPVNGLFGEQKANTGRDNMTRLISEKDAEIENLTRQFNDLEAGQEQRIQQAVQAEANQTKIEDQPTQPALEPQQTNTPPPSKLDAKIEELKAQEQDLAARLKEKMRQMRGGLNSNPFADPEFLALGAEYMAVKFKQGVYKFAKLTQEFIGMTGPLNSYELNAMKSLYTLNMATVQESELNQMDDIKTVRSITLTEINDGLDGTNNLESDSPRTGVDDAVGTEAVQSEQQADTSASEPGQPVVLQAGVQQGGDSGVQLGGTTSLRESGDQSVRNTTGQPTATTTSPGSGELQGSLFDSDPREGANGQTDSRIVEDVASDPQVRLQRKVKEQAAAEIIPVKVGDKDNIDQTLPLLLDGQREDVKTAEDRFAKEDGYGMLFTNGTGTGKTMTALGIIKRQVKQGKKNIIVVVPNDKVMAEWVKWAPKLQLGITKLNDTKDKGSGLSITTYANFGQNNKLVERNFDMVVMDEAHRLMQGAGADATSSLDTLRALTLHPSGGNQRAAMKMGEEYAELTKYRERLRGVYGEQARELSDEESERLDKLSRIFAQLAKDEAEHIAKSQGEKRPKALFLSATPFAYSPTVQWANGYLFPAFTYQNKGGYNAPNDYQKFMIDHFGYRMRMNKLTQPEAMVNSSLMERNFNSWLRRTGAVSSRMLDIDSDYDRVFAMTPTPIGTLVDDGLRFLFDNERFRVLHTIVSKRFDYLQRQRFLEAIKAKEAIPLIEKWHSLGRKVVVYYDYNEGGAFAPFRFDGIPDAFIAYGKGEQAKLSDIIKEFYQARPDLAKIDMADVSNPLETLTGAFPDAGVVNGMAKYKKSRQRAVVDFNDDNNPTANLLLVQSAINEGWSGHDTTSAFPRVLLNLGMPTQPTKSIQQEGRIYRQGQHPSSNSMFVYMNTGTVWERVAFAERVAERSGTAENLAMGEQARGLKDAFVMAFEQAEVYEPSAEEGKGGKVRDRGLVNAISDFDRAKAYYYAQQKKNSRTKAQEGVDYFATPEPLGAKMVEWGGGMENGSILEPSAGHGAISRFFPDNMKRTLVEPSYDLGSKALLSTGEARLERDRFEDFNIINKFDTIVMNPPFGTAGRTALDHLIKATTKHTRIGSRVVALVPVGSFDQKFDKWFYATDDKGKPTPETKDLHVVARILMPSVLFERAGTKVNTQVLIIDRVPDITKVQPTRNIDLTGVSNINEFFDRIEDMTMPERVEVSQSETSAPAPTPFDAPRTTPTAQPVTNNATEPLLETPIKGFHAKNQHDLFVVKTTRRIEAFTDLAAMAKRHNGYYSAFKGSGATPGFQFKTQEDADAFRAEGNSRPLLQAGTEPTADQSELTGKLLTRLKKAFPNVDVVVDREGYAAALQESGAAEFLSKDNVALGFVANGRIHLNPDTLNPNTAIHEYGHVWNAVAKQIAPQLHAKGLSLVKGTRYEKAVRNNPTYSGLTDEQVLDEALAQAIGDKGEKMLTQTKRQSFMGWLKDLWNKIKGASGIRNKTAEQIQDMTLDEFTEGVVADLLSGNPISDVSSQQLASQSTAKTPQFATTAGNFTPTQTVQDSADLTTQLTKPPGGVMPIVTTLQGMGQAAAATHLADQFTPFAKDIAGYYTANPNLKPSFAYNRLTKARTDAPFSRTAPGVIYDQNTGTLNTEIIEDLSAHLRDGSPMQYEATKKAKELLIGTQLLGEWKALNTRNAFVDGDGNTQAFDAANLKQETTDHLKKFENTTDSVGKTFRAFIRTNLGTNLLLPETMANLLGPQGSAINNILGKWRREWVEKANKVLTLRDPQIRDLTGKFEGLSLFDGRTLRNKVQTMSVSTVTDASGNTKSVEVPVSVAMEALGQYMTQKARYGDSSLLWHQNHSDARKNNRSPEAWGGVYRESENTEPIALLFEESELLRIKAEVESTHAEAWNSLIDAYNNTPDALEALKDAHRIVQGEELETVAFDYAAGEIYYPTQASSQNTEADPRITYSGMVENSRIAQERVALPPQVVLIDALKRFERYVNMENHYIADAVTVRNLINFNNVAGEGIERVANVGPKYKNYIDKLIQDLNNPLNRMNSVKSEERMLGFKLDFRSIMARYTKSIFAFNLGIPIKQIVTYTQAFGLGVIEHKHLREGAKVLANLAPKAYNIGKGDDRQNQLTGEFAEKPYIDEIAANPYAGTTTIRMVGRNEAYLGGVDSEDLQINPVGAGAQFARKQLNTIQEYGMGWIKRTDRAVIISFYVAAKSQVQQEINDGRIAGPITGDAALKRIADLTDEVVYATNQMYSEGDKTQLQRSPAGGLMSLVSIYTGQQQKLLNTWMQRTAHYISLKESGAPVAEIDKARKDMMIVGLNNILLNSFLMAFINFSMKWLKAAFWGDEEKMKKLEGGMAGDLALDTTTGILGTFPSLGTAVITSAVNTFTGQSYGKEVVSIDMANSATEIFGGMNKVVKAAFTEDDPKKVSKAMASGLKQLGKGTALASGFPLAIEKLAEGAAEAMTEKEKKKK